MPILCEEVDIRSFVNELLLVIYRAGTPEKNQFGNKISGKNFQRCGLIRINFDKGAGQPAFKCF